MKDYFNNKFYRIMPSNFKNNEYKKFKKDHLSLLNQFYKYNNVIKANFDNHSKVFAHIRPKYMNKKT